MEIPTAPSWMSEKTEEDENNWDRTPKQVEPGAASAVDNRPLGLQAALRVVELGGLVIPA